MMLELMSSYALMPLPYCPVRGQGSLTLNTLS